MYVMSIIRTIFAVCPFEEYSLGIVYRPRSLQKHLFCQRSDVVFIIIKCNTSLTWYISSSLMTSLRVIRLLSLQVLVLVHLETREVVLSDDSDLYTCFM